MIPFRMRVKGKDLFHVYHLSRYEKKPAERLATLDCDWTFNDEKGILICTMLKAQQNWKIWPKIAD